VGRFSPSGPLPQPFPLGSRWGAKGFPDSRSVPQPVLGRIAGKDDMNERLWHDAAMQKARVFPRLERKLLDLSLVILGGIFAYSNLPRLFFLRSAAIYHILTVASLLCRLARGKSSSTAIEST